MILFSIRNARRSIARLHTRGRRGSIPVDARLAATAYQIPIVLLYSSACIRVGQYPRKPRTRRPE